MWASVFEILAISVAAFCNRERDLGADRALVMLAGARRPLATFSGISSKTVYLKRHTGSKVASGPSMKKKYPD